MDTLPDADSIEIKALQTYSDGNIARWIDDPAPAGQDEPAHPAPILTLVKSSGGDNAAASSAPAAAPATTVAAAKSSSGGNGAAPVIAILALVLGLAGAVLGFAAYRRGTTRTT